ncbi:MAG: peptidylprolyl isomerase [Acidimicrobiaceae bacterium]|nr:peptidylprolyl isomerase [Acidimicrobiaceae bacterium]MYB88118.1 peptidylprolyl isomerase [Acidimicrobiaceae bacterium]MYH78073.1 peptidylprolyl isomerase [Acidimicrobiaceae bacterium]MYH93767.1 peptidylprolyl isomerase [Acidimicrobiaceae bacterium]
MSTAKRERQRENRRLRLAADETAAKQYATRRRVKLIGIAAVAVAAALAVLGFLQRNNSEPEPEPVAEPAVEQPAEPASEPAAAVCPAVDGSSPRVIDFDGPHPMCIDPEARYVATFDTSEGEMRFELTASETPLTVNNFVTLARWGYYDGTLLFRTDPSIDIIQGGSPHTNDNRDPGPGYTIPDEPAFDLDPETGGLTGPYRYQPGQLVMARSAGPDSASAQFFLTTGPNASRLDGQGTYVVFGQTDDAGLAVAQSIIGLHEPGGALGGAPSRDVTVHSVTIEET